MGDNSRDPIDHERTSRPRVGQTLKNPAKFPGLLLIAIGIVAVAAGLICFAYQQRPAGIAAVLIALVTTAPGAVWLARQARRARRLEVEHDVADRDSAG